MKLTKPLFEKLMDYAMLIYSEEPEVDVELFLEDLRDSAKALIKSKKAGQ